ncbi:F0F1 ATP synthase subunit A [Maridesulfovibrio hydrothermalis]|uniref:ATP synthase subunit a n=1 Tax=Maridesulfovibrio hydrothermalis AM13 = DSM 14728 TaxID=1121451 RepID=L0R8M0_9BACT|nr:F0F1 ATP synthase subunit A [Maridesulfovibrio hydrothermalis]CCO23113.1 ATP synthase subunit a [Maridesulfovibrio hydrothermalis AM13 = DSM 14728]
MAGGLPHPLIIMNELNHALGTHIPIHVWYTWTAMLILFVCGALISRKLSLVPGGLQNLAEIIIGGLEDFVVTNIGEGGRKVFPFMCTLFVFILVMNLLGLVPGCDAPTANVNTNAAMAVCTFLYYNYIGIKIHGAGYIKHFMGPIPALAPLMLIIELVSHISRPLSLTLRLFGNIRGEEIVLVLLFLLAPVVSTLPMYFLFMLAKIIQAFIFFMLTMIYLKGSLEHAH